MKDKVEQAKCNLNEKQSMSCNFSKVTPVMQIKPTGNPEHENNCTVCACSRVSSTCFTQSLGKCKQFPRDTPRPYTEGRCAKWQAFCLHAHNLPEHTPKLLQTSIESYTAVTPSFWQTDLLNGSV